MIGFWIVAALLLLAAYVLFLPALLGKTRPIQVSRQRLNLLLHGQRREELAREVDADQFERFSAELDKDMLGDLSVEEQAKPVAAGGGRLPLLIALALMPVVAGLLYGQLGRFDLANYRAETQAAHTANEPAAGDLQTAIDKLAERLKNEPNDLKGWLLLGSSLMATEQSEQAVQAYESALRLDPDNLDVQALYAQALAAANQGSMKGRPAEIVAGILRKDPKQMSALWLAGWGAAEDNDVAGAVAHWEALKAQLPANGEQARQLDKYIAEVRGESATAAAAPGQQPSAGGKSIRVKVSLADSLKGKTSPEDTVFIFARAASGPPMPLAVVRKQVKDLPLEVTLDDSMSMMQGMNIASFDKLVIGARVSKTGNAMPVAGDLQGMTEPVVAANGHTYEVRMEHEVQ